ncbi:hypothetical protein EVG20_g2173 [Dentipellis fragilis]|uniref:Uncharacterized protein n=1 Tax=Dentipellis fragilis TaxID=205917 RepID=A0A4Y9Z8G8_9AGAM|nr:hypothetical protein EVG20_g2173 [Dentipellis fragilis]
MPSSQAAVGLDASNNSFDASQIVFPENMFDYPSVVPAATGNNRWFHPYDTQHRAPRAFGHSPETRSFSDIPSTPLANGLHENNGIDTQGPQGQPLNFSHAEAGFFVQQAYPLSSITGDYVHGPPQNVGFALTANSPYGMSVPDRMAATFRPNIAPPPPTHMSQPYDGPAGPYMPHAGGDFYGNARFTLALAQDQQQMPLPQQPQVPVSDTGLTYMPHAAAGVYNNAQFAPAFHQVQQQMAVPRQPQVPVSDTAFTNVIVPSHPVTPTAQTVGRAPSSGPYRRPRRLVPASQQTQAPMPRKARGLKKPVPHDPLRIYPLPRRRMDGIEPSSPADASPEGETYKCPVPTCTAQFPKDVTDSTIGKHFRIEHATSTSNPKEPIGCALLVKDADDPTIGPRPCSHSVVLERSLGRHVMEFHMGLGVGFCVYCNQSLSRGAKAKNGQGLGYAMNRHLQKTVKCRKLRDKMNAAAAAAAAATTSTTLTE